MSTLDFYYIWKPYIYVLYFNSISFYFLEEGNRFAETSFVSRLPEYLMKYTLLVIMLSIRHDLLYVL